MMSWESDKQHMSRVWRVWRRCLMVVSCTAQWNLKDLSYCLRAHDNIHSRLWMTHELLELMLKQCHWNTFLALRIGIAATGTPTGSPAAAAAALFAAACAAASAAASLSSSAIFCLSWCSCNMSTSQCQATMSGNNIMFSAILICNEEATAHCQQALNRKELLALHSTCTHSVSQGV